jgi:hypothetical protein
MSLRVLEDELELLLRRALVDRDQPTEELGVRSALLGPLGRAAG